MMNDPDLGRSEPLPGLCNATDGFSVCTEDPGHERVSAHWDRRTKHEWPDEPDDDAGRRRTCPGGFDHAGHVCDAEPACPPGYPRLTESGWVTR